MNSLREVLISGNLCLEVISGYSHNAEYFSQSSAHTQEFKSAPTLNYRNEPEKIKQTIEQRMKKLQFVDTSDIQRSFISIQVSHYKLTHLMPNSEAPIII